METKQTRENIKKTFVVGFPGIIKTSGVLSLWKYKVSRYSLISAFVVLVFSLIGKLDLLSLMSEIQAQMIVFLPCILGFTIAGYSLVVGFVQSNMLDKISEPSEDSSFSLYQKMSGKFAMNVILQGMALIVAYFYHFVMYFDKNNNLNLNLSNPLISTFNILALFIISFWLIISILLVIQIVVNIFNFSQLHHYFINSEKVRANESKNKLK